MIDHIILLIIGMATSMLGALPFGLVNMTVLKVSLEQGSRPALHIAHGAALVEVLFGLTAILFGGLAAEHIEGNQIVSYFTVGVLLAGGAFFTFKKQKSGITHDTGFSGFLKGIFLNLISIQVFIFWILAIAFLSSRQLIQFDAVSVLILIAGIWIGKMIVLILYLNLSKKILSGSQISSKNINRVIGIVLFLMALVQVFKI